MSFQKITVDQYIDWPLFGFLLIPIEANIGLSRDFCILYYQRVSNTYVLRCDLHTHTLGDFRRLFESANYHRSMDIRRFKEHKCEYQTYPLGVQTGVE